MVCCKRNLKGSSQECNKLQGDANGGVRRERGDIENASSLRVLHDHAYGEVPKVSHTQVSMGSGTNSNQMRHFSTSFDRHGNMKVNIDSFFFFLQKKFRDRIN